MQRKLFRTIQRAVQSNNLRRTGGGVRTFAVIRLRRRQFGPTMCPLRLILVLLSAALAGYLAWTTIRSSPPPRPPLISDDSTESEASTSFPEKMRNLDARKVIGDGLWVFLDFASGKYLWRAMKEWGGCESVVGDQNPVGNL